MIPPDGSLGGSHAGALRNAVSALQNLHMLLRSPKVGPKAIAALLPEIRESCAAAAAAVRRLLADAPGGFPARGPIAQLDAFVASEAAELDAAISRAEKSNVDAKARLALEADVVRRAPSLDAARALVDLLYAAGTETPAVSDLGSLVDEMFAPQSQRAAAWSATATVVVAKGTREAGPVFVRPRVTSLLLHFMVSFVVASPRAKSVVRVAATREDTRVVLRASPANEATGETGLVRLVSIAPPTLEIANVAARTAGAALSFDVAENVARLAVEWRRE